MKTIPQQLVYKRWDALLDVLREALFSNEKAEILWNICATNHLSEEKTQEIAVLAGDVILGFIHLEDFANEIANETHIDKRVAQAIAQEADRKIFASIKKEIEESYRPPSSPNANDIVNLRDKAKGFEISINTNEKKSDDKAENAPKVWDFSNEIEKKEVEIGGLSSGKQQETRDMQKNTNLEEEFEAPAILHKETEIKPISALKNSLGGLFGLSKFNQQSTLNTQPQKPIAAEVNVEYEAQKLSHEPQISHTEKPKMRVINYSNTLKEQKDVFGGTNPQPVSPNGQQPKANRETFINISEVIKEEKEVKPIEMKPENSGYGNNNEQKSNPIKNLTEGVNLEKPIVDIKDIVRTPPVSKEETILPNEGIGMGDKPKNISEIDIPVSIDENSKVIKSEEQATAQKAKHIDYTAEKEIKLEDIPVGDDTIDLRKIEDEK